MIEVVLYRGLLTGGVPISPKVFSKKIGDIGTFGDMGTEIILSSKYS
jgi:hypothetical protein